MYNYEVAPPTAQQGMGGELRGNPGVAGTCTQPNTVQERESQVGEQCQALEREIQFQREVVTALFQRLQPVMAPTPPDGNGEKQNEPTCPLAGVMARFAGSVRSNTAGLNEILRRLEI